MSSGIPNRQHSTLEEVHRTLLLIFIGLVYLVMRKRQGRFEKPQSAAEANSDGDRSIFVLILVIGAMVAVGVVFALQSFWETGP